MGVHQTTIDDLINEIDRVRADEEALRVQYEASQADLTSTRQALEIALRRFMSQTTEKSDANEGANGGTNEPSQISEVADTPHIAAPHQIEAPKPEPQTAPPVAMTGWARKLQGMSQPQALMRIAELSGGVTSVSDAKKILLQAHLAKGNPRNLSGHIHRVLSNSNRFEKIGRGTFRLLPELRPTTYVMTNQGALERVE